MTKKFKNFRKKDSEKNYRKKIQKKNFRKKIQKFTFIELQQLNPCWEEFIGHVTRIPVSLRTFRRFQDGAVNKWILTKLWPRWLTKFDGLVG